MPKDREKCASTGKAILLAFFLISLLYAVSCGAAASEDCAQVVIDINGCKDSASTSDDEIESSAGDNSPPAAISNTARNILMALAALFISITGILGLILLFKNFGSFLASVELKEGEQKTEDQKRDDMIRRTVGMILGIVMVLSCVWVILYLLNVQADVPTDSNSTNSVLTIIIPVLLAILVFGAVLLMCSMHVKRKDQEVGTMRKTIAGLLVLGLVVVIFYSLFGKIPNENIVTQYIQLVGVIIAFYFGSRVAGVAGEKAAAAMKSQPDASSLQDSATGADESVQKAGSGNEEGIAGEGEGEVDGESEMAAEGRVAAESGAKEDAAQK